MELRPDLIYRQCCVGRQIEQAFFLCLELRELTTQLTLEFSIREKQVIDRFRYNATECLHGLRVHSLGVNHASQFCLDLVDPNRGHGAQPALLRCADEVLVGSAVSSVLAVDQAADTPLGMARAAKQHALQIVEMDNVPVAEAIATIKDLLNFEEGLFGDQRLMTSGMKLAAVPDDPGVVRISQYARQTAITNRPFGMRGRCTGRKPLFLEQPSKLADGVLARRVLLEAPCDQRRPRMIDVDGVHKSPSIVLTDVEVPELRASDASALFDLVGHLDFDVLAIHPDLDFVHDVSDCLHRVGHVALAELFLG